ncbi:MAG: hypothetical protein Ct9H300mP16_17140 [Pseudomonadota bacterium]|nr:MAG: hypothetical protein Ct9H300mP16_17140 [Pseudomonadota bacterium]
MIQREAFAVVLDRNAQKTFEAVVDLNEGGLKSWQHLVGVQPCILPAESAEMARAVKSHPDFYSWGFAGAIFMTQTASPVEAFPVANLGNPKKNTCANPCSLLLCREAR